MVNSTAMDINEILQQKPEDIQKTLSQKAASKVEIETIKNQLDPTKHDVFDITKRPKKPVQKPTGQKDSNGNDVTQTVYEEVTRIAIPFQKIIVKRAVGFLLGNRVKLSGTAETDTQKKLLEMVKRTWSDNKLDYFNRRLARTVMSQCEAAELWYLVQEESGFWQGILNKLKLSIGASAGKFRMRVKLLSPIDGDKLYPFYDEAGDMVAFSREYEVIENSKKFTRFDVYTAEYRVKLLKGETGWAIDGKIEANPFKKIPVVYYKQDEPEWYDAQSMIDRLETLLSNFGDTNDYFGAPMVFVKGQITGFANKGERGKVIMGEKDAEASYLSWDSAPEAIKIEIETLRELIYSMTQTPDISFSQMKNIGAVSGVALKLLFLDAHLKAENHIEVFGEMFQRRLNLIKSTIGNVIDISLLPDVELLEVEPIITPYMPRNVKEDVEVLVQATSKPIISVKTALEHNPLVSDPETELLLMDEESEKELEIQQKSLGASFNA